MAKGGKAFGEGQDYFKDFGDLLRHTYGLSPCQQNPEYCLPRKVQHVIWDADDTIWNAAPYGLASYFKPPYKKTGEGELANETQVRKFEKTPEGSIEIKTHTIKGKVKLFSDILDTLDKLEKKGITSSIASLNDPGSVERILKAMGLADRFQPIISDWGGKLPMVKKIIKDQKLDPKKVMMVDDMCDNLFDVSDEFPILPLCMGVDIESPLDILEYIVKE